MASYADIRTTLKKVEDTLPSDIEFESAGVRYLEREFLLIDAVNSAKYRDLILKPYLAKGVEFEHEHEVRIITRCDPGEGRISVKVWARESRSRSLEQARPDG